MKELNISECPPKYLQKNKNQKKVATQIQFIQLTFGKRNSPPIIKVRS